MKLRPVQLVCLALLLATLRLADPAALAPCDFALRTGVLNALLRTELAGLCELQQDWTPARPLPVRHATAAPVPRPSQAPRAMPAADLTTRWTMPPPASQAAAMQSFTSFLRA